MKLSTFALSILISFSALAAGPQPTLEQSVANDIQALLDDTVNEGEQTAYVVYEKNLPVVSCKMSDNKKETAKKWAFCHVDFLVSWEDSSETRSCGLLYAFDPANTRLSLTRGNEDLFIECTEYLSEGL